MEMSRWNGRMVTSKIMKRQKEMVHILSSPNLKEQIIVKTSPMV